MLQRLGSDPNDGAYVKPAAGDVWDFIRGVVKWRNLWAIQTRGMDMQNTYLRFGI